VFIAKINTVAVVWHNYYIEFSMLRGSLRTKL